MKPLKLILSGWGPFRDTQSIDFSQMQGGGVFLITGSTGAGKTTIFDGITFALYGEVSGSIREKDSLRSDFASSEMVTRVELYFTHRGKDYRIVRNPRYSRQKLRGDGFTTESETGELYLGDLLLGSGSQQVTEEVTRILGLDYRQFKQISMIAQGEFQQLLLASSKERTLIFRDIFQTGLYDSVTQSLVARVKVLHGKLEENKHRIEEVTTTFRMESEQWNQLYQAKNRNYEQIIGCVMADLEEKSKVKEALLEEQSHLDKIYKGKVRQLEQVKQNNRMIEQYEAAIKRVEQLELELKQTKEKRLRLKKEEKELPRLEADLEAVEATLRRLEEQWQKGKQWQREKASLQLLQKTYLELDAYAKKEKLAYELLEDQSKKAAAGILAQTLIAGQPCPVCGSVSHPFPAQLKGEIPDEKESKRRKAEVERHLQRAGDAQTKAAAAVGALGQLSLGLGEWKAALEADEDKVLQQMDAEIADLRADRERQRQVILTLKQACQEIQLLEEGKKAAYKQAKEGLHPPKERERQDLAPLNDRIKELESRRSQLIKERERIQTQRSVNHAGLKQLEEHRMVRRALEEEYGVLRGLERAASGANPRKLVLEQYVLSVYFEDILRAANLRLSAMTGERYELYRQEESKDRRMKEGMEIQVLDQYTGKRRSVKSLSGGESFKAALALALGTSDVVQSYAGGIQVETLFVDEGFGALDSESLGQAVDILVGLSGGERMIGIISHVEELKERIDSQILVKKNNNGSSIDVEFLVY